MRANTTETAAVNQAGINDIAGARLSRLLAFAFYFCVICCVIGFIVPGAAEADLWGHVKFGLDDIAAGRVLTADPYSYTAPGALWVNHEWLSEVVFAALYRTWGTVGLTALRLVIVGLLFTLFSVAFVRSRMPLPVALVLLCAAAFLTCPPGSFLYTVRPHLFTYLFFALELFLLLYERNRPSARDNGAGAARGRAAPESRAHLPLSTWLLPALLCLWLNLHGGVLAGLGILVVWVVALFIESLMRVMTDSCEAGQGATIRRAASAVQPLLPLLAVTAASFAACLINPYGVTMLLYLAKAATIALPEITEWHSLHVFTPYGLVYLALVAITLWCMHGHWRERLPVSVALLLCMLLPFKALRHLPLAVSAIFILASPAIAARARQFPPPQFSLPDPLRAFLSFVLALAGITVLTRRLPASAEIIDPPDMPVTAVDLLKRSGVTGNLACTFNWGQYCIWHLYPRMKVSMDSRRDTAYPIAIYDEYTDFAYGLKNWDALLKRNTDVVLADRATSNFSLMLLEPGWQLVYADRIAAIFVPASSVKGAQIRSALPPRFDLPREFP